MSLSLAAALFQSRSRLGILEQLYLHRLQASVSELARRLGLSPRAVANEVRTLCSTGLVCIKSTGSAHLAEANFGHAAAPHLVALLKSSAVPAPNAKLEQQVRESLAGWGAPLVEASPRRHFSLSESVLRGLELARRDGTVLRVLPALLAANLQDIPWAALKEDARRMKLKAELGWLLELTAKLTQRKALKRFTGDLRDGRRKTRSFFPEVKSSFEQELARNRTSALAKSWGFWMNVSEESFRSTLERHSA